MDSHAIQWKREVFFTSDEIFEFLNKKELDSSEVLLLPIANKHGKFEYHLFYQELETP